MPRLRTSSYMRSCGTPASLAAHPNESLPWSKRRAKTSMRTSSSVTSICFRSSSSISIVMALPSSGVVPAGLRLRNARPLLPAVLVADLDHDLQDVVPRLRFGHRLVGEHAPVPADVAEPLDRVAALVLQPEAGVARDVQLGGGVGGESVEALRVVRAHAVGRGVV